MLEARKNLCDTVFQVSRINLAIAREVHRQFAETCKRPPVGRSMNDAASRILVWFCRQSDPIQSAVMSAVDRGMERPYAEALRRLADELEATAAVSAPDVSATPSLTIQGQSQGQPIGGATDDGVAPIGRRAAARNKNRPAR
jgi:hypothetical protein